MRTRQVHLVRRPDGIPSVDDFAVREVELPALKPGQVLIENLFMSVDPYMRRSMDEAAHDLAPWPIGGALNGPSAGRIIESRNADFEPGDIVESMSGWQEHFISDGDPFVHYISADTAIAKRAANHDPKDYLGLFGVAAMTAYVAFNDAASIEPEQTVVISSGAGTVGSLACQIAKIEGARVVTSAGSDAKVRWLLDDIGVDFAFNYKSRAAGEALKEACPKGIDLVLENVSPEHLSACLPLMNTGGTALIAGFVSAYAGGATPRIENFEFVLERYLTIKAFPFTDYLGAYDRFVADMAAWRRTGKIKLRETIFDGLESAPAALRSLFTGAEAGKSLVRLSR